MKDRENALVKSKNRVVLITGSSGGIGRATARAFASAGFDIALHGWRHLKRLEPLAEEIGRMGVRSVIVRADVSERSQVFEMFDKVRDQLGMVDVLVNNAGIAQQKMFTDITEDDWRKMVGVDLSGPFYCCQAALPDMIREKRGSIINVSSMWGQTGGSCEVHYSAVKSAVIGLTRALAKEMGPSGITVNCVAPGVIQTEMNATLSEQDLACLADETPMGRLGAPEDIAGTILFLASQQAEFITGQVLGVNGGLVIG
ncbi:MAG: elongation factor P 5-aminopentanone reductase [Fastidiosipilaceae bacterium]|jgi:3-oxoacyl-[acyl-carrier protein] reductase